MSEENQKDLSKIDTDNDGVADRKERIIDYALAGLLLLITVPVFYVSTFNQQINMMTFDDLKVVLYLVTALSGGMTLFKDTLKSLIKKR